MSEKLVATEETAKILGVSKSWVEKARWAGNGPPYIKIGRAVRYRISDLEFFLNERIHHSTSNGTLESPSEV